MFSSQEVQVSFLISDDQLIGTGKSVLLREIIAALKKAYERNPEAVAVTASTGLAACNVGGITLHSFAAFGLGKEPVSDLAKRIKKNKKGFERWRRTKVLIIDEGRSLYSYAHCSFDGRCRALRQVGGSCANPPTQ